MMSGRRSWIVEAVLVSLLGMGCAGSVGSIEGGPLPLLPDSGEDFVNGGAHQDGGFTDPVGNDAGTPDEGKSDAGTTDAPDAGAPGEPDAGTPDAGSPGKPDAGNPDPGIPDAGQPPVGARSRARIFFSGHSLVDNPMPEYVDLIASGLGKDIDWNQQIVLGSTIRARTWGGGNWSGYRSGKNRNGLNMDVVQELRSPRTLGQGERYDVLLITERHDILGTLEWEDTVRQLRHFHDRLIDGNPQGTTYFYHTWLELNKANPTQWIDYEKTALIAWECAASKVNHTLQAAGRGDRLVVLPGGAALVDLVERVIANQVRGITGSTSQKMNAIFSDDVHLTSLGSYFMAAVHHASVFRSSPVGAPGPSGENPATIEDLQRIAWNFVTAYYAQPNPGTRTMADCRQRISQDVCPRFWSLRGRTDQIASCQGFFGNTSSANPFIWPDPNFQPHPAP